MSWNIILPDGKKIQKEGSLYDLSKKLQVHYKGQIFAAKVNGQIKSLLQDELKSGSVQFIDYTDPDGQRIYQRSLKLLLLKAIYDLYPQYVLSVEHSLGKGVYCQLHHSMTNQVIQLSNKEIKHIESYMCNLVDQNLPFVKLNEDIDDARDYFIHNQRDDMAALLSFRDKTSLTMYRLEDYKDYLFGTLVPTTGFLKYFGLKFYIPGFIVRFPDASEPTKLPEYLEQPKLFEIFRESQRWNNVLGIHTVTDVNKQIWAKMVQELILINESFHEKKIAKIADAIASSKDRLKLILIAGPSSSGKTSFAQRLRIQLKVNGIDPIPISLDDYFVNREQTPIDEDGNFDFESIEAIDIGLFNEHLSELINGSQIELPTFNFKTGEREYRGKSIQLLPNQPLIIEGIHCLNERLTKYIPKGNKYKIYVSALTSLNFDRHNRIPTADLRLLRRIVRDHQYRGNSAQNTIRMWQSVRKGEEKNIFPFQEEADIMFNSTLLYEISVLKTFAEKLLYEIPLESFEYVEAQRLLRFLSYVEPIEDTYIPCTSFLKEFIGGSCLFDL
ncbi:hypothetical protein BHU72_07900 [Desulfuribacillus stibiiarsenatis]|uniref:Phosphoribulokinase/uridine kinase domain-containing protein n=1 Tax=Desulfuribacillus stibiiarsenatis TaxID=1390249 RepID=A0A1E5L3Q8_9FIRM|nr:nucleoside kinase [Desulfuribacillus stibiiarsenatis]OEH84747.1 hypothetical protein BHU72_07900 [Desulfuribacillus stibiiarsenatis]